MPELQAQPDERRACPDCGCERFHLLRRRGNEHTQDFTNVVCADCENLVGSAGLIVAEMEIECPGCESVGTQPFAADYDWFCQECGYYFDSRTMFKKGEVEAPDDE